MTVNTGTLNVAAGTTETLDDLGNDGLVTIGFGATLNVTGDVTSGNAGPTGSGLSGSGLVGSPLTATYNTWTGAGTLLGFTGPQFISGTTMGNDMNYHGNLGPYLTSIGATNFPDVKIGGFPSPQQQDPVFSQTAPYFKTGTDTAGFSLASPANAGTSVVLWGPGTEEGGFLQNGQWVTEDGPFNFTVSASNNGQPINASDITLTVVNPVNTSTTAVVNAATDTVTINNVAGNDTAFVKEIPGLEVIATVTVPSGLFSSRY